MLSVNRTDFLSANFVPNEIGHTAKLRYSLIILEIISNFINFADRT